MITLPFSIWVILEFAAIWIGIRIIYSMLYFLLKASASSIGSGLMPTFMLSVGAILVIHGLWWFR